MVGILLISAFGFGINLMQQRKAAPDFTLSSRIKVPELREVIDDVEKGEDYTSHLEVAAYIYRFGTLPPNYRPKKEQRDNPDDEAWATGGDHFGNYEERLPEDDYREADVNMTRDSRGPERLVYSDDGDIYYTKDHYETFEQLVEGLIDETLL